MKMSASVSLLWFGCGGNTERMRERERTRLTILDYGEKNGQNWMTVKKQVNACKLEYRTVARLVVLKERNANVWWLVRASRRRRPPPHNFSSQSNHASRPFTVSSLNRKKTPATFYAIYTTIFNAPHTHNRVGMNYTQFTFTSQTKVQLYSIHKKRK